jgi:hypothetical protein
LRTEVQYDWHAWGSRCDATCFRYCRSAARESDVKSKYINLRCVLIGLFLTLSACSSKNNGNPSAGSGGLGQTAGAYATGQSGAGVQSAIGGDQTALGQGGIIVAKGGSSAIAGTAGIAAGGKANAGGRSAGSAGSAGATSVTGCTREKLKANVDAYYKALAAHDFSTLPLASNAKYTENGQTVKVGEGLWKTAASAEPKLKRNVLDTQICTSVTESVIAEGSTDIILGLRLKLESDKITEIEAIIVRSTADYFVANVAGMVNTKNDDWETAVPADKRPTRETLQHIAELYFANFPAGACNFSQANDCMRVEDGTAMNCNAMMSCGGDQAENPPVMKLRLAVLDVDASITLGFTMFSGQYSDFHLFRYRDGQITRVHAILASAKSSGWD